MTVVMNSDFFTDLAITETIREHFAKKVEITRMIVRDIQTGTTAHASIFRVKGGHIYTLIRSSTELSLGDVTKMLKNMGVEVSDFSPPGGAGTYFDDKAVEKYKAVFPSKRIVSGTDELRYYRTLVPYTPALVQVERIHGELREYDPQVRKWHVIKRLTYAKIQAQE